MGLLDKVKAFAGGKSAAKVTIPVIEGQSSETAVFPVADSVLKGTMVVEALQPCTLLGFKFEIWLYCSSNPDDTIGLPNLIVTERYPDPKTSYTDDFLKVPHDMKAGETVTHPWMVMDIDLAKVLVDKGYPEADSAVGDPRVRLVAKCIADVKGSPFDPSAEVDVALTH